MFLNRAHATDLKLPAFSTFESIEVAGELLRLDAQQPHLGGTSRTPHKRGDWYVGRLRFGHAKHQAPMSAELRVDNLLMGQFDPPPAINRMEPAATAGRL